MVQKKNVTAHFLFFLFFIFSFPLHGRISWLSPLTQLSSTVSDSTGLAVNDNGETIVVWVDNPSSSNWRVNFATFTPGGGWSSSQILTTQVTTNYLINPRVALNNNGQILVMWEIKESSGSNLLYFSTNTFSNVSSGNWSTPTVAASGLKTFPYGFGMNKWGQGVLVNVVTSAGQAQLVSQTFTFGDASWKNLANVGDPIGGVSTINSIDFAINESGRLFATVAFNDTAEKVTTFYSFFSTLTTGGGWSMADQDTTNNNSTTPAQVTTNNNDQTFVTWTRPPSGSNTVRVATFTREVWDISIVITTSTLPQLSLQGEIDSSGRMVVAWSEGSGTTYTVKVATASFPTTTSWTITTITTSSNRLDQVKLALLGDGSRAVLIWQETIGGNGIIKATTFSPTNVSPNIVTISDPTKNSTAQVLAGNMQKLFVANWTNSLMARAGFDLLPPENLHGHQISNRLLSQKEYINQLHWETSTTLVNSYRIYANGLIIGASEETKFDHRGQKKGKPVAYSLSSVSSQGDESERSSTVVVP